VKQKIVNDHNFFAVYKNMTKNGNNFTKSPETRASKEKKKYWNVDILWASYLKFAALKDIFPH
jgi:hypothetical protein